jgi:hypothetical protein
MATQRPVMGYWFNRGEPGAFGDELYPAEGLAKFRCASWSEFIGTEGYLELYRIDVEELVATGDVCDGTPRSRGVATAGIKSIDPLAP